jgi:hypothetical protein
MLACRKELPDLGGASLLDKYSNMPCFSPRKKALFRSIQKSLPGKNHKNMHKFGVRCPNGLQKIAHGVIFSCGYYVHGRVSRWSLGEKRNSAARLGCGGKMTKSYFDTANGTSIGSRPWSLTPQRPTPTSREVFRALLACTHICAGVSNHFTLLHTMYGAPFRSHQALEPQ